MTIIQLDDYRRSVLLERFCNLEKKDGVVFSPGRKNRHFAVCEILLKLGIQLDIISVVAEQVKLDVLASQEHITQMLSLWLNER
jgi:hypothetical protein